MKVQITSPNYDPSVVDYFTDTKSDQLTHKKIKMLEEMTMTFYKIIELHL